MSTPSNKNESPQKGPSATTVSASLYGEGDALNHLSTSSLGVAPATLVEEIPFPQIPGYEILSELGRGGMGVVYKACQIRLNRVVALKMILAGEFAKPEARVRFLAEAEVIAQLQHPGIVQVYEFGSYNGQPFFVLEYVGGGSLEDRIKGEPQAARLAAELTVKLTSAIQAAHDKGIIHRDIKPANVMLTEQGEPKITDFGLAKKATSELTATGAVMGTPSYMAPEQAAGKRIVGPATDVYALGAILYEQLTGRPPFKAANALDTMLQVVHEEPISPKRLQPKLSRDLETIVLKCLHKDPTRRYASATALGADLGCFLEGKPITARPVSFLARALSWGRRNPTVASLLLVLVGVVAAAFMAMLLLWMNAQEQRDVARGERHKAELSEAEARQLQKVAEAQSEKARIEAAKARKVVEVLVGLSQAIDPFGMNGVLFIPRAMGEELTVRDLLMRSVPRIRKDLNEDPIVKAAVLDAIGQSYVTMGKFQEAEPLLKEAYQLRLEHCGPDHPDTVVSHLSLGWFHHQNGEYLKADTHYRRALALRERQGASEELIDFARFRLAWLLTEMQEYEEAKRLAKQIIDFRSRHFGEKHRETAIAYISLAALHLDAGEVKEAVAPSFKAMQIFLAVEGSGSLSQALGAAQRGWFAYGMDNFVQAEKEWREAIRLLTPVVGARHPLVLLVQHELARACQGKGDPVEAEKNYRAVLEGVRATITLAHPKTTILVGSFANFLEDRGKAAEGQALFEEHIAALKKRFGSHRLVAAALVRYNRFLKPDALEKREALLRDAVTMCQERQQTQNETYAIALKELAHVLKERKQLPEAERLLRESLAVLQALKDAEEFDIVSVKTALATVLIARRNLSTEAETLLKEVIPFLHARRHKNPLLLQTAYRELNLLYRLTYRLEQAKAVALERRSDFPKDPVQLYFIAMELAMMIPQTEKHPTWTPEQKQKAQEEYTALTLQVLQEAAAHGFDKIEWLERDAALFEPLKARKEYQEFLRMVEKRARKQP